MFRECLKNHSCNPHVLICGIFCLHAVDVACYAAFIQAKSSTNCNGIFQKAFFKHEQGESEENYEKTTEKGEI